jgi:hypothetical protein
MEDGVNKARKEVPREHCFGEPDHAAPGAFAEANAWTEAFDVQELAQPCRRHMFVFWTRLQTEPEGVFGFKEFPGG